VRWIVGVFGRFRRRELPPPEAIDREALREEMMRNDPAMRRVRTVHHDAQQAITAGGAADGLAIRREREFWQRHGGQRH
jgi:hypothetical protein